MHDAPPFRPHLGRALALGSGRPGHAAALDLERLLDEACRVESGGAASPASCGGLDLSPWRGAVGLAGECFQEWQIRHRPGAARDGQVFTPWALARRLVELLEPAADQQWLDPAAGAGIFLQAAGEAGVPASNCQALELDPAAASLGRRLTPGSSWLEGDALAEWSALPSSWQGAFHRVILNPPYRNGVERRDPAWNERRAELRGRFATTRGPFDLYVPFVERALEFLRPGGRLGLLLPNTWLASRYGRGLRLWLAERAQLLRLQHAPAIRLFPRADFEALLLVVERLGAGGEAELRVDRLERGLTVVESHSCPQSLVRGLAGTGWGPLLRPERERRMWSATRPLGERHEVRASLSADEYYRLEVRECPGSAPGPDEARLLSSGAIEPFRHTWSGTPVRFRGVGLLRPVVRIPELSAERRRQVETPRVLVANLSRRLEALAVAPGEALGVVNVMQVLCRDLAEAQALAAWLNSESVQAWVRTWHDPLRMNGQLSLSRELVASLPGPPRSEDSAQAGLACRLAGLGAELQASVELAGLPAPALLEQVEELARALLPAADPADPQACPPPSSG